jgi:hypothetical protein
LTFCNGSSYIQYMEIFRTKKGTLLTLYALIFLAALLSHSGVSYCASGRTDRNSTAGTISTSTQTSVRYQALPLQISNISNSAVHLSEKSVSYNLPLFMQAGIAVCICILAAICQFLLQSDKTLSVNKYKRVVSALQTLR